MNILQRFAFKNLQPVLVVALIACAVTLVMMITLLFRIECQTMAETMGREWQWQALGGCAIQADTGKFIPLRYINIDLTK